MRKSVVFPEPFGPTSPTFSPGLSWKDASTKRICLPYCLFILLKEIMGHGRTQKTRISDERTMLPMAFWDWLGLGGEKADSGNHLEEIETVLAAVTPERARYLACFAYILTRPARADHQVTDDEAAQMRAIMVEQDGVTSDQASAIVEAARTAAKQAGGTEDFLVTREFERIATRDQKLHLRSEEHTSELQSQS